MMNPSERSLSTFLAEEPALYITRDARAVQQ